MLNDNRPALPDLEAPEVLRDSRLRLAFRPADPARADDQLVTDLSANDMISIGNKLRRGQVVIDFAGGFGEPRRLALSPAEMLMLYSAIEKFMAEMPK